MTMTIAIVIASVAAVVCCLCLLGAASLTFTRACTPVELGDDPLNKVKMLRAQATECDRSASVAGSYPSSQDKREQAHVLRMKAIVLEHTVRSHQGETDETEARDEP